MREGSVFFKHPLTQNNRLRTAMSLPVDKGYYSAPVSADFIYHQGAWHQLVDDGWLPIVGKPACAQDRDGWPLDEAGQRVEGNVDTRLLTIAVHRVEAVSAQVYCRDELDGWDNLTCSAELAKLLFQKGPEGQARLLFDGDSLIAMQYPKCWAPTTEARQEAADRAETIKARLANMVVPEPPLVTKVLGEFEAIVAPISLNVRSKLRQLEPLKSFIKNTRNRALKQAIEAARCWLNGYPVTPPEDHILAVSYSTAVDHEISKARERMDDLKRRIAELTQTSEPVCSRNIAMSQYGFSEAMLKKGREDSSLRTITVSGRHMYFQSDLRRAARVDHRPVQPDNEIPRFRNLEDALDSCEHLIQNFDPTCRLDLAWMHSVPSKIAVYASSGLPLTQHDGITYQRYWAKALIDWLRTEAQRQKKAVLAADAPKITRTQPVALSKQLSPNAFASRLTTAKQSSRLVVMSNSASSNGYIDFLHELGDIPHELISLGYQEDAIATAIERRQFAAGTIISIVRGGGDLRHDSFKPFLHMESAFKLKALREAGVVIVTGVGHAKDRGILDLVANHAEITPTKAGQRVKALLMAPTRD